MSYADHLIIEYVDVLGEETKIIVQTRDYSGTVLERDGQADPLTIAWGDNASPDYTTVYGSTANISVWAETDSELSWLFNLDPFFNLVIIEKNNHVIWKGFVDGSQYREQRHTAPKPVNFVATDMLVWVMKKEFDVNMTGVNTATISAIISNILDLTQLDLPIITAFDFTNNLSADYMSLSKRIDQHEGQTNAQVIEDILYSCRLQQRDGAWYIISYSNFTRDGMIVTVPAGIADDFQAGDFHSGDFRTRIEGTNTRYLVPTTSKFWFENQLIEEYLGYNRRLRYTLNYDKVPNLITQGSFDALTAWSATGTTLIKISGGYKHWSEKLGALVGGNSHPASPSLMTNYIVQIISGLVPSSECLHLQFKYGMVGAPDITSEMYIELLATHGTYNYYGFLQIADGDRLRIGWTATPSLIRLGGRVQSGAIVYDDPVSASFSTIYENLQQFDLYAESILYSSLVIRLFGPYTASTTINAVYDEMELQVVNQQCNEFPDEYSNIFVWSGVEYTGDVEDIEFSIGDFPNYNNKKTAFRHGLFNYTSPYYTTGWRRTPTEPYMLFNTFRTRVMLDLVRQTRRAYQAKLADVRLSLKQVIIDEENGSMLLLENGMTYNDHKRTIEGQFVELLTVTI